MSGSLWVTGVVFAVGMVVLASFSLVISEVRQMYVLQMVRDIAEARERLRVGAYAFDTRLIVELRNRGASAVLVRNLRAVALLRLYNVTTNASVSTLEVRSAGGLTVPPWSTRYVDLDFTPAQASYERVEISSATITIETEHTVLTVQAIAPLHPAIIKVSDADISPGGVRILHLTNETAMEYVVYEVLFCGLVHNATGLPNRANAGLANFDSIWASVRGGGTAFNVTRHYGLNWTTRLKQVVTITVNATVHSGYNVTTCVFSSNTTIPAGTMLFIGRGLLLVTTHHLYYEVAYIARRGNDTPVYFSPEQLGRQGRVSVSTPQTQFAVIKFPLISTNVTEAVDYIGQHLLYSVGRGSAIASVGSFQLQAVLVSYVVFGQTSAASSEVEISAYIPRLVPLVVFFTPYEQP